MQLIEVVAVIAVVLSSCGCSSGRSRSSTFHLWCQSSEYQRAEGVDRMQLVVPRMQHLCQVANTRGTKGTEVYSTTRALSSTSSTSSSLPWSARSTATKQTQGPLVPQRRQKHTQHQRPGRCHHPHHHPHHYHHHHQQLVFVIRKIEFYCVFHMLPKGARPSKWHLKTVLAR